MLGFLRTLDKKQIIHVLQRLVRLILPLRPYSLCGRSARCPCPANQMACMTGLAIGDEVHFRMDNRPVTATPQGA